jgi:GMP synthase-like glutamine amidotransferase
MIRVAVLDMYNKTANLGMNNIIEILETYPEFSIQVFDVRGNCELPSMDFDIYISSGGPGSPLDGDGLWDRAYYHLMDKLWVHNQRSEEKKHALFICHSFQMICHHLSLGSVVKRKSSSFGVFPVHKTLAAEQEEILINLDDPFYVADFRKWQFIHPHMERMERMGCKILLLEKIRPHVPLDRAIMGMRFSPEWLGFQFHPEADPSGMYLHFTRPKQQAEFIEHKGELRFSRMLQRLKNPFHLTKTHQTIIPGFLNRAIKAINSQKRNDIAEV